MYQEKICGLGVKLVIKAFTLYPILHNARHILFFMYKRFFLVDQSVVEN